MKKCWVAIDPGLVTGVSLFYGWGTPYNEEINGGLLGFVNWFEDLLDYHITQVYIENWQVRPNTHKLTPQPDPYLIIGYVKGRCHTLGLPFEDYNPSQHKSFNGKGKQSKVRRLGWVTDLTKDGHAEDAASVLLTGLVDTHPELALPLLKEMQ